ncbi:9014_t:CDS:2 [Funneliformis geosporum]|uniref:9014_t:CDS:1 n=1 Tax=Funneliformis geosporum TaxID=1117311 RepID=A0A9W4SV61_9GLOM|nr:9014_t:CDS:2 [Funneliformis geosporum]
MYVQKLDPIMTTQRISSWKEITQMFISDKKEYEKFKERCLDDYITRARLREIYDDQLDEKISQHTNLHAELNILTKIVDQKYRRYNIITSGTHNKIYHRWMLPNPRDTTFGKDAQSYILANLNLIINEEITIAKHTNVTSISDSALIRKT